MSGHRPFVGTGRPTTYTDSILLFLPSGEIVEHTIEPGDGLDQAQRLVGGDVEFIALSREVAMLVDEHGAMKGLAPNTNATDVIGLFGRVLNMSEGGILGPALLIGINPPADRWFGLPRWFYTEVAFVHDNEMGGATDGGQGDV